MYCFPNLEQVVPCLVLTVSSWHTYRFLRRQVRWSSILISWRIFPSLLWPHSQRLWHRQESRNRCSSGTLLLFQWPNGCWHLDLWFLCLSKSSLNIWKFTVHGTQPCLTQWNYEPCHVEPRKVYGSWWRVLTKHGLLEKGMENHFSILVLRTPWTVWKGKTIGSWKMNSRGW